MRTRMAHAIRAARQAACLTQKQLGMRLELKGRAVYRWERGESAPTRRHRRTLIAALNGLDPKLTAELVAAFAPSKHGTATAPAAPLQPPTPTINPATAFELFLFRMADELDLPPRRVRTPLSRLLKRARAADLTLDALQHHLEAKIANS